MHYVVACKRLKTVENYYILSREKWFWLIAGGHHLWQGFSLGEFGVSLMGTGCLLELVTYAGSIV